MTTQTIQTNNNNLEKRVSVTMTNKGHHSKQMEEMKEQNALVKYLNQKTSKRSLLCCKRLHIVHLVILFFHIVVVVVVVVVHEVTITVKQ